MSNSKLTPDEEALLAGETRPGHGEHSDTEQPDLTAVDKQPAVRTARKAKNADTSKDDDDLAKIDGVVKVESGKDEQAERGTMSPAQYDDDGWGNTPVQMRG